MNKPKGTKDIFGIRQDARTIVKSKLCSIAKIYNFKEIETPIYEKKDVFTKTVGETSDIISKEMFEFKDKKNRDMVLRPEGTAGTIRAIVENKLYSNLPLKLFYLGPMFRYENPQKGRQRQFTQFGVEFLSEKNVFADAEIILMASNILKNLGIKYKLLINSIGDKETRDNYSKALKEYFYKYKDELSKDSLKRLEINPMRILDDKIDSKKEFVKNAPKIKEFYSEKTKKYYEQIIELIKLLNIDFEESDILVRGLDYYTDTVFEFISISNNAGSQNTLIAGGRYENLVKNFGGPEISGIGFALGLERIVNEFQENNESKNYEEKVTIYIINLEEETRINAMLLSNKLRSIGIKTEISKPIKLIKGLEKADKLGAKIKIILGKKEVEQKTLIIKYNKIKKEVQDKNITKEILEILEGKINETN